MTSPPPTLVSPALAALVLATAASCGCDGGVDAGDPSGDGPALEGLELLANDANVLSFVARWTTAEPATSRVEFGRDGALTWVAGDGGELTEEHEVLVIGLSELSDWSVQAVSVDAEGREERSDVRTWSTPELPFASALFEVTDLDADAMEPGWTLMNLAVDAVLHPTVAVMLDPEGAIRWYHQLDPIPTLGDVEVSLVDGDRVLIGGEIAPTLRPVEVDLGGIVRWEGPRQPDAYLGDGAMHHTLQKLDDGTYLTLTYDDRNGVLADAVEILDPSGETVWRWAAADHIPGADESHVHVNMALADLDDGAIYVNSYLANALYKVDRASGEILWTLGAEGDFTMTTESDRPWFSHAHAPEIQGDGSFLFFDNGGYETGYRSRLVQIALDEAAMTAEIVWEYPGSLAEDEWFAYGWGDADRQPNGNTLATMGSLLTWDSQSHLFEVTAGGDKVWQVTIASETEGQLAGAYMAERIPVPIDAL